MSNALLKSNCLKAIYIYIFCIVHVFFYFKCLKFKYKLMYLINDNDNVIFIIIFLACMQILIHYNFPPFSLYSGLKMVFGCCITTHFPPFHFYLSISHGGGIFPMVSNWMFLHFNMKIEKANSFCEQGGRVYFHRSWMSSCCMKKLKPQKLGKIFSAVPES